MDIRLRFLSDFLNELEAKRIWYMILRNHEDIYLGKEKDIDMLCSPSDFGKVHTVFSKLCSEYGHICNWNVSGKTMSLSTNPKSLSGNFEDFSRGVIIDIVSFVSIRDSLLKIKIPGHSRKLRDYQIKRERLEFNSFQCWAPSPDWLLLFLLEKMQYKRKAAYKKKILDILRDGILSKTEAENKLRLEIVKSLENESTRNERLIVVQKVLRSISYERSILMDIKQWVWLGKMNLFSMVKRKGLIITFSGPDGAGKTTTKSNLIDFIQNHVGITVNSIKGLNRLNEPKHMGGVIKKIQHKTRGVSNKSNFELEHAHRDRKPNKGGSFSWKLRRLIGLLFILVQYPVFYFIARIHSYRGVTTVVDTSVFDRFIKAHRPRFKLLERIFCPLLPAGDLTFRLYASPKVINKRKPELTVDELEEYYAVMDHIFSLKSSSKIITIVTESGTVQASQQVNEYVLNELGSCELRFDKL